MVHEFLPPEYDCPDCIHCGCDGAHETCHEHVTAVREETGIEK